MVYHYTKFYKWIQSLCINYMYGPNTQFMSAKRITLTDWDINVPTQMSSTFSSSTLQLLFSQFNYIHVFGHILISCKIFSNKPLKHGWNWSHFERYSAILKQPLWRHTDSFDLSANEIANKLELNRTLSSDFLFMSDLVSYYIKLF